MFGKLDLEELRWKLEIFLFSIRLKLYLKNCSEMGNG